MRLAKYLLSALFTLGVVAVLLSAMMVFSVVVARYPIDMVAGWLGFGPEFFSWYLGGSFILAAVLLAIGLLSQKRQAPNENPCRGERQGHHRRKWVFTDRDEGWRR